MTTTYNVHHLMDSKQTPLGTVTFDDQGHYSGGTWKRPKETFAPDRLPKLTLSDFQKTYRMNAFTVQGAKR